MTALSSFHPFVLPNVAGVASAIADHHIRQAAIEFCKRTLVWRTTLAQVPSVFVSVTFSTPLVGALGALLTVPFAGPTRTDYLLVFTDGSEQVVTLTNGSLMVVWANPVTAGPTATFSQTIYPFPVTTDAEVAKFLKFTVDGIKRRVVTPDMGEDMVFYRFQQQSWDDVAWTVDRLNFSVSPPPMVAGTLFGTVVALQPTQTADTFPDHVFGEYAEDIAAGALARLLGMNNKPWTDTKGAIDKRAYFEHRIGVAQAQVAKGFSRGRRRVASHPY